MKRIVLGNCIKKLKEVDKESVDLVFADPPFNIGYEYDEYDDCKSADDYVDWSRQWIKRVIRVLKPTGTFWLAIGDEYAAELKVLATRDFGLTCRSWVVWYYTFGAHCKTKFTRSHTHLFYFVRNAQKFTFNDMAIRVPSARQLVYGDKRAHPKGRVPDDTWLFSRVCGTFSERQKWHPCQMPEQLLGRIINACSNKGNLILDPFAGSGTTLAVAKKLNRRYAGIEISKKYVAGCRQRLKTISPGDPLYGDKDLKGNKHADERRAKTC